MTVDLFLSHRDWEIYRIPDHIQSLRNTEYEIGDRLASGGNAVVHRCIERITGQEYAIKFQLVLSPSRARRFEREIEILREIRHDQLISYIDHGEVDATIRKRRKDREVIRRTLSFVIMAIAESNLKELLRASPNPLSFEEYIAQFKGLARALSALHTKAVHRDIKPENILIIGETWVLSDFGLCKFIDNEEDLTEEDEPIGPRYWMSPEAINRAIGNEDEVSKQSDVFQLCSIFWFIVTGRHPSGCVCRDDWTGPQKLYEIIFRALSHNDANRPLDGEELSRLLDEATLPQ